MSKEMVVYTDGGSRGNPGPAAAAFVLTDPLGKTLCARALFLGRTTNNVAEYTAVCRALEEAVERGCPKVTVLSDSELLVEQVNGRYKVKSDQLRPLFRQALKLLGRFQSWQVKFIPRAKNMDADRLVNRALNLEADIEEKLMQTEPDRNLVRLGVLISGGGTTLVNILRYIEQGKLNAEVALVISSRSTLAGVERAKAAGLEVKTVRKKDYPNIDEFSRRIERELVDAEVDLVVQGGWLCLWKIPATYENRVMNIHPALLPSFGGQGMWGHHVHEAVLAAGCKVSGCTVHFCTNEYDKGPIIVQRCCQVKDDDTPETLAARVFEQECIAYPQAIKLFQEGRLLVQERKVRVK